MMDEAGQSGESMYRNMLNIKKVALTCLFLMSFPSIVPNTLAGEGSTVIHVADSKTIEVREWELSRPFGGYYIELYAIPSFEGSNTVSWSTDRDSMSPGETLSLTTSLEEGEYDCRMDFRVVVKKKSTGKTIIDKTKGKDIGSIDVPGSFSSRQIPIIIPLELIGIPAELTVTFQLSTSTDYLMSLSTYGLDPKTESLRYESSTSMTSRFSKSSGLGSEIYLKSAGVEVKGNIIVSLRLSVTGVPLPFKKEIGSIPIGEWEEIIPQDVKMILLKTPIEITASLSSETVELGESVELRGSVEPPSRGMVVKVIMDGTVIDTAETLGDGSFKFVFSPIDSGSFSVIVRSTETKYSTVGESQPIQLEVNKPPLESEPETETETETEPEAKEEPEPSFLDKIPGFPYESIILGLMVGAFILFLCKHKYCY